MVVMVARESEGAQDSIEGKCASALEERGFFLTRAFFESRSEGE